MREQKIKVTFGNLLDDVRIPKMYRVRQKFSRQKEEDVRSAVRREMDRLFGTEDFAGKRIAVTAGSRGISHSLAIMEEIIRFFKNKNATPFVVPAMGSHGGGTAEGQLKVLEHFGMTEKTLGVEFCAKMDTVEAGRLLNGVPVYFSKAASEADGIFVWNKIKPHADFKGEHESGLVKMLAIGLGKHHGCASLHRLGFENFPQVLPEAAKLLLKTQNIIGGLGIVENAYDEPAVIEGVLPGQLLERDRELLKLAKEHMPCLKVKEIDVLIVDEIGKNISGEGMDPNVTGRPGSYLYDGFDSVNIKTIVVLDITEESDGNGAGIGMADITTVDCVSRLNLGAMYTNSITAGILGPSRLPIILNNDREAIRTAIKIAAPMHPDNPRIVRIHNTLELYEIWVSEALAEEYRQQDGAEVREAVAFLFDEEGKLRSQINSQAGVWESDGIHKEGDR